VQVLLNDHARDLLASLAGRQVVAALRCGRLPSQRELGQPGKAVAFEVCAEDALAAGAPYDAPVDLPLALPPTTP